MSGRDVVQWSRGFETAIVVAAAVHETSVTVSMDKASGQGEGRDPWDTRSVSHPLHFIAICATIMSESDEAALFAEARARLHASGRLRSALWDETGRVTEAVEKPGITLLKYAFIGRMWY